MKRVLSVVVSLSLILCSCGKSNEPIMQRETIEFEERTILVRRYGKDNKPLGNNFGIKVKGIVGKTGISLASLKKLVTEDQCNITKAFYYDKYDKIGVFKEEPVKVGEIERIRLICDNESPKPMFTPKPSLTPTPAPTATTDPVGREIRISYINEKQEVIEHMTLPVRAGEGKTIVNINTFKSVIPKDKCNNITEVFYISEGTRKVLTGEDVTLDEVESVDLVCWNQEASPSHVPTPTPRPTPTASLEPTHAPTRTTEPTPTPEKKSNKYAYFKIVGIVVAVFTACILITYVIRRCKGGQTNTKVTNTNANIRYPIHTVQLSERALLEIGTAICDNNYPILIRATTNYYRMHSIVSIPEELRYKIYNCLKGRLHALAELDEWKNNEKEVFRTMLRAVKRLGLYDKLMTEQRDFYNGLVEEEVFNLDTLTDDFNDVTDVTEKRSKEEEDQGEGKEKESAQKKELAPAQEPDPDVAKLRDMLSSPSCNVSELAISTIRLARQNKLNLVSSDIQKQLYTTIFNHTIAFGNDTKIFKLGVHVINALGRLGAIQKLIEVRCGQMGLVLNTILAEDVLDQH
ncbi:MAG: hypothetical protein LBL77_02165 [Endomicrobium sp.]|jgi:hypothetical protein|nr:hypothetical protein [Endomicrobium sp.]